MVFYFTFFLISPLLLKNQSEPLEVMKKVLAKIYTEIDAEEPDWN